MGSRAKALRVRRHKPTPRLLYLARQSHGQLMRCVGQDQETRQASVTAMEVAISCLFGVQMHSRNCRFPAADNKDLRFETLVSEGRCWGSLPWTCYVGLASLARMRQSRRTSTIEGSELGRHSMLNIRSE
jgi:hypothetical protein